jgi:hypothetical protein
MEDRFFEELEHMFAKIPQYHMKVLLGDFSAKVCRKDQQLVARFYMKLIMIIELEY